MKPAYKLANDAIKVLREKGWHQGSIENRATGALCLVGAIGHAANPSEPDFYSPTVKKLFKVIGENVGYPNRIGDWNDRVAKNVGEVINELQKAKRALR